MGNSRSKFKKKRQKSANSNNNNNKKSTKKMRGKKSQSNPNIDVSTSNSALGKASNPAANILLKPNIHNVVMLDGNRLDKQPILANLSHVRFVDGIYEPLLEISVDDNYLPKDIINIIIDYFISLMRETDDNWKDMRSEHTKYSLMYENVTFNYYAFNVHQNNISHLMKCFDYNAVSCLLYIVDLDKHKTNGLEVSLLEFLGKLENNFYKNWWNYTKNYYIVFQNSSKFRRPDVNFTSNFWTSHKKNHGKKFETKQERLNYIKDLFCKNKHIPLACNVGCAVIANECQNDLFRKIQKFLIDHAEEEEEETNG